ncbi:MAG TPA: LCP family protein [Dehalococcoidia bacterium]|nr:LCP family protein [Dehalococcoidia bacterium]
MSRDQPPFERPQRPLPPQSAVKRRHFNPLLIFGIAGFAVAAFYLLLVVVTQLDDIFFPGNEISIGVTLPGLDTGNQPQFADINQRINILFLGLDIRRDEPADMPARTDTVFVLTVDPYSKTAGVFSIPRDLLVDIPDGAGGYVQDRINVAYEMGQYTYNDYPGGGPGLVKDSVEKNFGIPIDYYVLLNFNNFIDLIDEIGGIDVDIPAYAYDNAYNDCNACPYYPVEFFPGPEHMDGERALAYARIRASDNDFKRIERQQLVIRATAKKALDLGLLLSDNPLKLYRRYKDAVKSDIPDYKVGGLALLAQQIGMDNIRMVSLADATFPCSSCNGAMLDWDREKVEEIKASVFNDGRLQLDGAQVQIQNGTDVPGLADQFASLFKQQGLAGDQITTDDYVNGTLYDTTLIVNLSGKRYTAEKLAEWLKLPVERIVDATDPRAAPFQGSSEDVIVALGADASLPSAAAAPGG